MQQNSKYTVVSLIVLSILSLLVLFQNCSDVGFSVLPINNKSLSEPSYIVNENEVLNDVLPRDLSIYHRGKETTLELTSTPSKGEISNFDPIKGTFTYTPVKDYYGLDQFNFSETIVIVGKGGEPETQVIERTALINIMFVNDVPKILTEEISVEMNTTTVVNIEAIDIQDGKLPVMLSEANDLSLGIEGGNLVSDGKGNISLTTRDNYRGTQTIKFWAKDSDGAVLSRDVKIIVGNPLFDLEPAMAVRASACISCHAKVDANYITDFGFGDSYFFGNLNNANDPFDQEYYGDHRFSWITARFNKDIIVPKDAKLNKPVELTTNFENRYNTYAKSVIDYSNFYHTLKLSTDLKTYLEKIEGFKQNPAKVVAKNKVRIAAPSIQKLNTILSSRQQMFYKDSGKSQNLSGLSPQYNVSGANIKYYKNTATLECDGDLILNGALILRSPTIRTINGCRIYVNGPVFISGKIKYIDADGEINNTNLQITSTRMVSLGVGLKHCETAASGGWYHTHNQADSPMRKRLQDHMRGGHLRNNDERGQTNPATANNDLLEIAKKLDEQENSIIDASCDSDGGRSNSFDRLLVNAPLVHSRYEGSYQGVIIGEVVLFSLSKFSFKFDPVFKRVPILPLLDLGDFLEVK